jgi:ribosomal protein S12 methylthiotransferase
MMGRAARAGFALVPLPEEADVVVVNTCAFVAAAERESIAHTLALAAGGRRLVVAGCLAERHGPALLREIPEIAGLVGPGQIGAIARVLERALAGGAPTALGRFGRTDLSAERVRSGPPHLAYVKISEGCDRRCAFCLIPRLRGPQRSRTPASIQREVTSLGEDGVREVVLVAQDTTAYGRDLPDRPTLAALLRRLREAPGPDWIRVLYGHPDRWTEDLTRVFAQGGRLVPYVDLPIQHVAAPVLRAMGRGGSAARIGALVERLRARVPGVVLRATVMTGHPGEGEAEFEELLRFLRQFPFDRLGAFAYSPEAGTRAETMARPGRREALRRRGLVLRQQQETARGRQAQRVGRAVAVLIEGFDARCRRLIGRSYAEAPEIDGQVRVRLPRDVDGAAFELGRFLTVRLTRAGAHDLDAVPLGPLGPEDHED